MFDSLEFSYLPHVYSSNCTWLELENTFLLWYLNSKNVVGLNAREWDFVGQVRGGPGLSGKWILRKATCLFEERDESLLQPNLTEGNKAL